MPVKPNPRARRRARRALVQAVYQWQMTGADADVVEREFVEAGALDHGDLAFFRDNLRGVLNAGAGLDELFAHCLDRELSSLDRVELAILRLGTFELAHRLDVPYRVVIDEYVELAKIFGAEDSYKYVNGVLDRVARVLRLLEQPDR